MQTEKIDTIIIGGGLSGVYAAARLAWENKPFLLLEARSRLGGRILSPAHQGFHTDLGPSWYWPVMNPRVTALIKKLGLKGYPQFESGLARFQAKDGRADTVAGCPMEPEGWRIHGGMISLVNGLRAALPKKSVRLNHRVCEIRRENTGVTVVVGELDAPAQSILFAETIILALPPRLAARSILFTPDLSHGLTQAMLRASTWMAGHAKFFALYEGANWRRTGFSGQGFSLCGPLSEIHDGSCAENRPYGLTGFVGIPALRRRDEDTMVRTILLQLAAMYGEGAGHPVSIHYKDWAREEFTATEYDKRCAHNHPEFLPPSGKTSFWDGKVHFAGTETADEFSGYLEGALAGGERAAQAVGDGRIP